MKSKPSWPNAAAPSAGLLRAAAASVHSLPPAPRVQKLVIICSHLLQMLSQALNELTDLFLVSVYWLHDFIPQSPLGFSNSCTYSRGLFRHSPGAACSSAFPMLENRNLLWRARDTQQNSAPKVLLCQDSLRFWRILKRMMKQGQNTALHKVEIKCICPQKEHKKLWASMPWQAENEQPEAIHVQRAANTAKQQLSTSFCSLSMTNSSGDFPIPKKERGNFF